MDFECIEHPCVREAAQHCAASRTFAKSAGSAPSLHTIMRGGSAVCVLFFLRLSMVEPPLSVCTERVD